MLALPGLYRDSAWWYWLIMVAVLAVALMIDPRALNGAIALTALQVFHYAWIQRSVTTLRVQVRVAYLLLLLLGQWPTLFWIHWLQLLGTTGFVLFGYCPLARTLSLAPWNRAWPPAWSVVARTFFSAPVPGNILRSPVFRENVG